MIINIIINKPRPGPGHRRVVHSCEINTQRVKNISVLIIVVGGSAILTGL